MASFKVRRHGGSTLLFCNGKAIPNMLCYVGPNYYMDFKKAGIRIVTWRMPIGWVGPKEFDYTMTDRCMEEFLSLDSEILFLPRIQLRGSSNDWWCQKHTEELVRLSNGEIGSAHSTASEIWRQEAAEALTEFIGHVESSSYADHILGYHICDGHFSEWFAWGSANFEKEVHGLKWVCGPRIAAKDCPTPFPDYSEPMVEKFRKWLRKRYKENVHALREAWKDQDVDFSSATIPTRLERVLSEDFIIRDPSKCRKAIDYDMCFQDVHSDTLLGLCRVAKQKVGAKKIVGVFYGYTWGGFHRGFYMQHAGHLALSKVLDSPYVDFIASPIDYENRSVGGVSFSQSIPETVALHGKLFFNEVDPKTYLTSPEVRWHHKEDWRPRTPEDTLEILKRNFSYTHAMGTGMWWMDLFEKGWYHDDEIIQALSRLRGIEDRLLEYDRSSNREIAIILDEKSMLYERPCQNMMVSLRYVQRQWELGYMGAPFDTYLQSDLLDTNLKDYRMYIFPNNSRLTKAEREEIKRRTRRNGNVAVWVWAPGLIVDDEMSLLHVRDLTEINISLVNIEARVHIDIVNYEHPVTRGLPRGHSFGPEMNRWHMIQFKESGFTEDDPTFAMGPVFYSDDPGATVLGMLPAIEKPGFCVKEFGGWKSVYAASPVMTKDVLRNIAKFAGVHIYVDSGDLVYANKHFLSVYPRTPGRKTVRLPELRSVTDLWNDYLVTENAREFDVEMKANRTYMYLLE